MVAALGSDTASWFVIGRDGSIVERGTLANFGIEAAAGSLYGSVPPFSGRTIEDALWGEARTTSVGGVFNLDHSHTTLFVAEASASCWSGDVVRQFSAKWNSASTSLSISIPRWWSSEDVERFRQAFGVAAPITQVTPLVDEGWQRLRRRYGVGKASVFAVTTSSGRVEQVSLAPDLLDGRYGGVR
jgi:hypothetical protein